MSDQPTGSPPPTTVEINGVPVQLHLDQGNGSAHGPEPGSVHGSTAGGVRALVDAVRVAAAAAQRGGPRPVITVNGRTVDYDGSSGPRQSAMAYLDPAQQAAVQSALSDLVARDPTHAARFQQVLGVTLPADNAQGGVPYGPATTPLHSAAGAGAAAPGIPASAYPSPETVVRLADPPRPVPVAYRLATFTLVPLELFLLFIGALDPMALWILQPTARPVGLLVATAAVVVFRARRHRSVSLLRWGRVATVTDVEPLPSVTRYRSIPLRRAVGWTASTSLYSGPGRSSLVRYTLDGREGRLTVRGLGYEGGVVLADSRDPARARCVSQVAFDLTPGPDGQWQGRLSPWLWCGIVATLLVELTLVYVTVLTVARAWLL